MQGVRFADGGPVQTVGLIQTHRTDLMFALNGNWDVLYDTAGQRYLLLSGEGWLSTPDLLQGPRSPARE